MSADLGEPVLDPRALAEIRELQQSANDDVVARLIRLYVKTSNELLHDLAQALEEDASDAVNHAVHSLKSASAHVGATRLAELCRLLEERSARGELDDAAQLAAQIQAEHDRVQRALGEQAA